VAISGNNLKHKKNHPHYHTKRKKTADLLIFSNWIPSLINHNCGIILTEMIWFFMFFALGV
jgi:hypothetical protein